MAPLWFGPTAHQQMNSGRLHQMAGVPVPVHGVGHPGMPPVGPPPPPRIVHNGSGPVTGPPHPYPPRVSPTLRGQQYPHGPPRAMPPLPPSGGPGVPLHMQQKRPFVPQHQPPHPSMRMGTYANDGRRHGPPPDMRGRMPFPPPHMHRSMPPQHMMRPGMPHHAPPPPHMRGMHSMGPPRIHGPPDPNTGAIPGPPPVSALPVVSQAPAPLREVQNENLPPKATMQTIMNVEKQQSVPQKTIPENNMHNQDAAADAAEILLGLRTGPSPPPMRDLNADEKRDSPPSVPDCPIELPTRLAVAEDESKLNSMHCFLRSDLLELFVVERSTKSPKNLPKVQVCGTIDDAATQPKIEAKAASASGRVGLRCVHCAKVRMKNACSEGEAPMAVFYPKSISELYRLVTSWQRVHLRKCRNLPPSVREMYETTRLDKSRGKTQWWVTSAKQLGLVDCTSKAGGIRFKSAPYGLLDQA